MSFIGSEEDYVSGLLVQLSSIYSTPLPPVSWDDKLCSDEDTLACYVYPPGRIIFNHGKVSFDTTVHEFGHYACFIINRVHYRDEEAAEAYAHGWVDQQERLLLKYVAECEICSLPLFALGNEIICPYCGSIYGWN